jgi:hypothetical protein
MCSHVGAFSKSDPLVPYAAVASINGAAERFSPTRKREAHIPRRVQECSRPIARTIAHRAPWRCPKRRVPPQFRAGFVRSPEALYRAAYAVVSYQLCFLRAARSWGMDRPQKITFAEMRDMVCAGCSSIAPTTAAAATTLPPRS